MSESLHRIYRDVESQHSVEQGCLTIEMMLAGPALCDLFVAVFEQSEPEQRSEDPGLHRIGRPVPRSRKHRGFRDVQSRVSFSLDCQSPAETDSDHSTMPISV